MKPGTFTQMYVHIVFAIGNRYARLTKKAREIVYPYIGGIINDLGHKLIIINGTEGHIHILFGMTPSVSVADTVHDIKRGSSIFINSKCLCTSTFRWQNGYGGFTCSRAELNNVHKYIREQEQHHSKIPFRDEYITLLKESGTEYKPEYLFNFDVEEP